MPLMTLFSMAENIIGATATQLGDPSRCLAQVCSCPFRLTNNEKWNRERISLLPHVSTCLSLFLLHLRQQTYSKQNRKNCVNVNKFY